MDAYLSSRPVWAHINLDYFAHNVRQLKKAAGEEVDLMAVVKAGGYGHGAVEIARTALGAGAKRLAVAFAEEGLELRRAGIEAPVLLFGYTEPGLFPLLIEANLTPTVFDKDTAAELSAFAVAQKQALSIHIKIDTGMGRLGLQPEMAPNLIEEISALPGLHPEGLYTHLAAADEEDLSFTHYQLSLFRDTIEKCARKGLHFELLHAANSAGSLVCPQSHFNLIRPGIALYGSNPLPAFARGKSDLKAVMALKSRVVQVKNLTAGKPVSYGLTYKTTRETTIATVSAGYADGYNRLLSNNGAVLVRGERAPVTGRVCMDYFMIDVSHIPGVHPGDEVVLFGTQGAETITADEIAKATGTISYEVFCSVGRRVPRLFFSGGQMVAVRDYLQ